MRSERNKTEMNIASKHELERRCGPFQQAAAVRNVLEAGLWQPEY